jgi:AcrR family transcriptional regulator
VSRIAQKRPADKSVNTRRTRGTPRALLLDAARALFAQHDYRSITTIEIAERADVHEHLLFRNFGSKAALFREAVVVQFLALVDDLTARWGTLAPGLDSAEAVARAFLGSLYDIFVENRGLVMTLSTATGLTTEELEETGIAEIDKALGVLGDLGSKGFELLGIESDQHQLAAYSTVAMVAGMAAFGPTFFGGVTPSREVVVEELAQATLHGYLHRGASN